MASDPGEDSPPPAHDVDDLGLLARGALRVDLGPRELIVAGGADRIRFLHGIVTGDVAGTPPGRGGHSALLTPKGHVVADLRIFVRSEDVWIVVAPGQGEPTAAALSRYAIMDDFTASRRADFALVGLFGPAASDRLARLDLDGLGEAAAELASQPPLAHAEVGGLWLVRARELGVAGFWLGGHAEAVADADRRLAAAGVPRLSRASAEAARIAAGEPREGSEITSEYFPMEVGLDDAIDYAKGCYLGQEPIVRIRDRGRTNWRLVGLEIEGPRDPAASDAIESDVKPKAGRITSAARLPGGAGVALALLHISVPDGSPVRIHHGEEVISARVRAAGPAAAS
jgi:folate-binding protein YgfZ